ncbi:CHAT domain-containing protein [Streptomyces sp. NRRL S-118]|uniref:CHAT domain-containing protein n=1 Tax=Streptomyces sp. NRRL S-118 TaxID=1463881 RepID=UPI000587A207|nr:CHAT domain-containing protein [Streptomyces sp. NRRL S-118]
MRATEHQDADALFAPEADGALRGLLSSTDLRTDLEARHAAGWLYWCRAGALGEGRGGEEGAAAGMLLLPVWAADPASVPEPLADRYAADVRPETVEADGPPEWSALCVAATIATGRVDPAGAGASPFLRGAHELAARLTASGKEPRELLTTGTAAGALAFMATRPDDPAYPTRASDLAGLLAAAARTLGDRHALDLAVTFTHHALKRTPAGADRLATLGNLGLLLCERFEEGGDPEDLQEAIGIARDAVEQAGEGHPRYGGYLSSLGYALRLRLLREGGTLEDHDEVVDLFRRAAPRDPRGPGPGYGNLGSALLQRYQHTGAPQDLEEAAGVLTRAAAEAWPDPAERTGVLNTQGSALRMRAARTGRPEELDAALVHLREVLADTPRVTRRTAGRLVNPALALQARYERDGVAADAEEAVRLLRTAVAVLPVGHPERAVALDNLGRVLHVRYGRTGRAEELEEAVRALREAVEATPAGHDMLGARLLNLGGALTARYHLTGDSSDLREALGSRHRAAELPGLAPAARAAVLGATGGTLLQYADRNPDRAGAAGTEDAVAYLRSALELTPPGDSLLPRRRLNLAIALVRRAEQPGRRKDLREARRLAEAALAALPEGSPDWASCASVLAGVRAQGLTGLRPASGLAEVTGLLRAAADATPPGHPARTRRLIRLGAALRARHERTRDPADLAAAAEAFDVAAREEQCPAPERLDAAREWGRAWADQGRFDLALEGFTLAVDLLPSLAPRRLLRDDQEFRLGRAVGLGAEAAACAHRCGDPGLAVRLLEQARGVLLAQAFDADSDLTRLRAAAPELADRFEALREDLDAMSSGEDFTPEDGSAGAAPAGPGARGSGDAGPRPDASGDAGPRPDASGDAGPRPDASGDAGPRPDASEGAGPGPELAGHTGPGPAGAEFRRRAATAWQELLEEIRSRHPELRLFRPVREWDVSELRAGAEAGPVVLIAVSAYGSCALVITISAIEAVPLHRATPEAAAERNAVFQDALALLGAPDCTHRQALRAQAVVRDVLAWLWSAVTGPVLRHLGLHRPPAPGAARPRLWWSAGSSLGALPLHAAAPDDGSPGALDLVVSSYVPTLRALRHARARVAAPAPEDTGLLIVAVPDPEGLPRLPEARREAEWLAGALPGARMLSDHRATGEAVGARLREHAYVHFACHAMGDPLRPSGNRLVLHDHAERPLTVRDVARLRLPDARLAYLSACDTLRTGPTLADESVSIVSAFQMAGFPHVIGALWPVDDAVGARIARTVYGSLHTGDGGLRVTSTAEALHTAVREVRADYPATPSLWACLVHAGA